MLFFYNLIISLYGLLIRFFAFFNPKAGLWLAGRKDIFSKLEQHFVSNPKAAIWFHTASLGEFEQGRPVWEGLWNDLKNKDDFQLIITFFSPSGYEVRKNYKNADLICYLPLDTPQNAQRFLSIVRPKAVLFVKYEFWYHFLHETQKRKIPLFLFSATFRREQIFFKSYGGLFRKLLQGFTHIFVQNEDAMNLLQSIQIQSLTLAGDTRFDRVLANRAEAKAIEIAQVFKQEQPSLIVGSCWAKDLDVLIPFLNQFEKKLKVIIAPHEIKEHTFKRLENELHKKMIRFSEAHSISKTELAQQDILLIDNVGMLASLYQYGTFAYIGGAFGEGLHNILEPAVFGIPVFFGKDYRKYPEASDLINQGGAFTIRNKAQLKEIFEKLYANETARKQAGDVCADYIRLNQGGALKIVNFLKTYLES